MKSGISSIVWGYLVELMLSGLLYAGAWWLWGFSAIHAFIEKTASEWAALTGTLFAASLAIWLTFVNIRATSFGDYLDRQRAVGVYSAAFVTAMVVHLAATICLITAKGSQEMVVAQVALALMLYGGINLITLIRNASGLVTLYSTFRRKLREIQAKARDDECGSTEG